jgi:hypothetical protein
MKLFAFVGTALIFLFAHCKTTKNVPTNTSSTGKTVFSLNGNWQLASSSDNKALEGTVLRVIPGITDATINTLGNNTYCFKEMDVVWKGLKNNNNGVFSFDNLVNSCNGAPVYKAATLTVVNNDEVRLQTRTAAGAELTQVWKRVYH